jgi:hypothetical protein
MYLENMYSIRIHPFTLVTLEKEELENSIF